MNGDLTFITFYKILVKEISWFDKVELVPKILGTKGSHFMISIDLIFIDFTNDFNMVSHDGTLKTKILWFKYQNFWNLSDWKDVLVSLNQYHKYNFSILFNFFNAIKY